MAVRWIIALAALVTAAVTARLGVWQLDRAAQKESVQAAIEARALMPEVAVADLATDPGQATAQHHRVARLQGRWMSEHTVFLDNRPMGGRAGFHVLTPLRLEDGSAVVVQRGWQPRDLRDRTLTQPVPGESSDTVLVRGRLAPPPSRLMEFDAADQGVVRQNLDMGLYAAQTGVRLRPVTLVQLEQALVCAPGASATPDCSVPLEDGLRREWAVVAGTADKNRGYAAQWFALSALVLGLYVWFQLIVPWRQRRVG